MSLVANVTINVNSDDWNQVCFILSAAIGRFLKNAWNKEPVILVSCGIGLVGQFTAAEMHILWKDTTAGTLVLRCKLCDVRSAFTIPQLSSLDAHQYRNVRGWLRFPLLLIIDFIRVHQVCHSVVVFTRTRRLATYCEALCMLLFESLLFDFNPVFYALGVVLPFISPFSKYSGMINSATPYTYPGKHIYTYIFLMVVVLHVLK